MHTYSNVGVHPGVGGPSARRVNNHRPETNEMHKLAIKHVGKFVHPPTPVLSYLFLSPNMAPQPWLGTKLGRGAYGICYKTRMNPTVMGKLAEVRDAMEHMVMESKPRGNTTRDIAIKITTMPVPRYGTNKTQERNNWLHNCVRENLVHQFLSKTLCQPVPGCTRGLCVKDHIAKFYYSGLISDPMTNRLHYITVMDVAPGEPLSTFNGMTLDMYLAVERAACTLWVNGIAHADLHGGNILYDAHRAHATIIDFGFAVQLLPVHNLQIATRISQGIRDGVRSLAELFRPPSRSVYGSYNLQGYMNRVLHSRRIAWYYPNSSMTMLYGNVSFVNRLALPHQRRVLWGFNS